jgi:hypothetical protein
MGPVTPGDIGEALSLHHRVTDGLSREIFVPTPDENMRRLVRGDGISVGVWHEGRMVCMRAVVTEKNWVGEELDEMGVPASGDHRTAYTDFCVVDRDFRGNNVQFLTHYAIENITEDRYDTFYTTVSPKNSFSLLNILGCNFLITDIREMYGGYLRYVMRKDLARGKPIWTHGHLVIRLSDIDRQRAAIAEGLYGYKVIRKHGGFWALYAPVADNPPKGYWKNMALG